MIVCIEFVIPPSDIILACYYCQVNHIAEISSFWLTRWC